MTDPCNGATSAMTHAKAPMPQLSIADVDRLLAACVRPVPRNDSILELLLDKAPRIWRPAIERLADEVGQKTPSGRIRVPKADWEALANRLRARVANLIADAEHLSLVDQEPSPSELEAAPLMEPWAPGHWTLNGYCLGGRAHGDPNWHSTRKFTSRLESINFSQGWARTREGLYRLGQRLPASEIGDLTKQQKLASFREVGDEELELILRAERADVAWRLGRITSPRA